MWKIAANTVLVVVVVGAFIQAVVLGDFATTVFIGFMLGGVISTSAASAITKRALLGGDRYLMAILWHQDLCSDPRKEWSLTKSTAFLIGLYGLIAACAGYVGASIGGLPIVIGVALVSLLTGGACMLHVVAVIGHKISREGNEELEQKVLRFCNKFK